MENQGNWDARICGLPGANFLQSDEWARIKAPVGWQSVKHEWPNAAAQLLLRKVSWLPISIAYIPRGPLVDWSNPQQYQAVLDELITEAKKHSAIFLKIDPALVTGRGIPGTSEDVPDHIGLSVQQYLVKNGWFFSPDQIQFRNTVEIDLKPSEEALLMRMHQKTRYNIRLAEKKGVQVSEANETDWPSIYRLYAETAERDGFIIRPWDYYQRVWSILSGSQMANCLQARVENELVGAIWLVGFGEKAHYLYGMSSSRYRELMPNHLLQWRGMLLAKSQGRTVYDMWGAPDEFTAANALSGVFRFKQGFGGEVIRTIGAWDYPIHKTAYKMYTVILPKVLNILRNRSRVKNRQILEN